MEVFIVSSRVHCIQKRCMFFIVTVIKNCHLIDGNILFYPSNPVVVAFIEALKMKVIPCAHGVCLHFCLSLCLFCPRIRCLK